MGIQASSQVTFHLHALNRTYPVLLQKTLPNGYSYIAAQYTDTQTSETDTANDTGGTVASDTGSLENDSTGRDGVRRARGTPDTGSNGSTTSQDLRINTPASDQRGVAGEDTNGVASSDSQATTRAADPRLPTGSSPSIWLDAQGTDERPAEGLTALEGTKSAPNAPYEQRNLLVNHFGQSVTGLTGSMPLCVELDQLGQM